MIAIRSLRERMAISLATAAAAAPGVKPWRRHEHHPGRTAAEIAVREGDIRVIKDTQKEGRIS